MLANFSNVRIICVPSDGGDRGSGAPEAGLPDPGYHERVREERGPGGHRRLQAGDQPKP